VLHLKQEILLYCYYYHLPKLLPGRHRSNQQAVLRGHRSGQLLLGSCWSTLSTAAYRHVRGVEPWTDDRPGAVRQTWLACGREVWQRMACG